jgi:PEP-CTERM/exosortase A-associated glycosyltransferase
VRVLHVLHSSFPAAAGYTVRTASILRFQRAQGLELAGVTSAQHPNGDQLLEEIEGVPFWRTRALGGREPTGLRELEMMRRLRARVEVAIRAFRPDLNHAHSPMLVGIPALRAARTFSIPVVYELRDLWENPSLDRGKFKKGSILHRAAQAAENHVLQRADALVAICETLKAAIAPRAAVGTPIFVVENGVDVERFEPRERSPALVAKHGLEGRTVLVYLGTFQPYEGVDLLVDAMPGILARIPSAHLLVVGGGGELPSLVERAGRLGLQERITFTGRVPHAEVADLFPLGDLFVYPRLLTATTALTTPLKPLEAMSMSRPVLVSDIAPMRELVSGLGGDALVFRPGDVGDLVRAVVDALADRERLARIGRAGRALVTSQRTWARIIPKYADVYAAALARSRRRADAAA